MAALMEWESVGKAVPAKRLLIKLSLQGTSQKSILIHRMDVEIVKRRPALRGPLYYVGGGGLAPSRLLAIDLDSPHPKAVPEIGVNSSEPNSTPGPVDFPFFVSETELEYFIIIVTADKYDCEWVGKIHWTVDGKNGVSEVSNNGNPLRLTGASAATSSQGFFEDFTQG
ncbi:hypothetical protein [Streptomyces pseudovenezuelae]|uniref:hypothetical protein n=1 Tax=Streptomyces pseudovenezuelae TaxID=67350 RepID=UPI002E812E20|nr:hypothetical protein [Streptomyces pseudovenezuelae]WUA93893.1 hypothetical protein OHO81_44120 [Streptomyces pseudovenezuelae]